MTRPIKTHIYIAPVRSEGAEYMQLGPRRQTICKLSSCLEKERRGEWTGWKVNLEKKEGSDVKSYLRSRSFQR